MRLGPQVPVKGDLTTSRVRGRDHMKQIRRAAALTACVSASIMLASWDSTESQPNASGPSTDRARTTPAPSGRDGAVTLTGAPQAVTAGLQAPSSVVFRNDTPLISERDTGRILELADDGPANLRGEVLRAVPIADPSTSTDYYAGQYGRIRDVTGAPDGDLWFVTNNTDGRGDPGLDDDRILSIRPFR
jgi:glucose/arabinose dehydrogenase